MDRTTIVFLIATFVAFWIIKNRLRSQKYLWTSRRRGCEPVAARYPHLDPFFGLDLVFEKWKDFNSYQFSEGMRRRHDKQGTTFLSNDLGKCCINTIDPKNVMAITTTHFDDYGKSSWTKEAEKHIGRGILMNDGERWKRSRAMLQPIFTRASRDEPSATMDGHVQQLIDVILQKKGEAFDFRMLSSRFMLDTVTRSLFGNATNVLGGKDEEAEDFLHCVSQFEAVSTAFIGMGPLALLRIAFRYGKILAYVRSMQSFFRSKITKGSDICKDDSQESSRTTTDFLKNLEIQGLDMTELQGELQNVFFASYDTTAALLANIFDVLGRRPDVQYHLRNEIASVVQGRSPFIYDLSRMKYLRNTIWESLRLYSPVTYHSRRAIRDTILPHGGGPHGQSPILIQKGTEVSWCTYALNRAPSIYGADSLDFKPERWEGLVTTSSKTRDAFTPFGSGPRQCIGQRIALSRVSYVVVRLLQTFSSIESRDDRPFIEAKAVSFFNGHGTILAMSKG